ncbi:Inorganic pyrophosphatase [hydrothermal vent metagenome]|uniref:Inorganic pyrophosphatase n=1 Tax=hydrothermal vent metagenome TaxID=652676 RepID=A0A1W1BTL9_9ZZZZ
MSSIEQVNAGDIPNILNVIIEIPANSSPVKYELDKETNALFVDRFLATPMFYPVNYGFVPQTLSDDGDPADVLVLTPYPLVHNCVVKCRPVGVLKMTDDGGIDAKILAVPIEKLGGDYSKVQNITDISQTLLNQIEHFFTHYKDLEKGKWVKIDGWEDKKSAELELIEAVKNYQK